MADDIEWHVAGAPQILPFGAIWPGLDGIKAATHALGLSVLVATGTAAATALDPSFGTGGRQYINFNVPGTVRKLALQPDGKIVAVGNVEQYGAIARLLTNGAADSSFNGNGTTKEWIYGNGSQAGALTLQADGKILIGGTYPSYIGYGTGSRSRESPYFARHNADGSADVSFGSYGILLADSIYGEGEARDILMESDGRFIGLSTAKVVRHGPDGSLDSSFSAPDITIAAGALGVDGKTVAFGYRMHPFPANAELGFVRYSVSGVQETAGYVDAGGYFYGANGALQPDGKILLSGGQGLVARFLPSGDLDTAFAAGGKFTIPGKSFQAMAVQPDGKIVVVVPPNEVWRLTAAGALDASFGVAGQFGVPAGDSASISSIALQPNGHIVVGGSDKDGAGIDSFFFARIDPDAQPSLTATPFNINFAGQSMGTASAPQAVTITNSGGAPRSIGITVSNSVFVQTNDCPGSLAPMASCVALVRFKATPSVGPINATSLDGGVLSIVSDDPVGLYTVRLAGTSERSFVSHYYRAILRREPESAGKQFWSDETVRMQGLAANVNETWFSMAGAFYNSAEYLAFNRDNAAFVTDLYNTFFNRAPDSVGLEYWTAQMERGMPRDGVLVAFMFSTEFTNFTQAVFGNTSTRAEIDMVMDFYRGLLGRLPDTGGFNSWLQRLRYGQCLGDADLRQQVEAISAAFALAPEYGARNRSTAQYVSDLYNAIMRRGPELAGLLFWIDQINNGARSREAVRREFMASPEFANRVTAVIRQGCY